MNPFLAVLIVYSGFLVVIGALLSRTVRDSRDFFVAGRQLSPGLLFATLLAANIGAGSTIGAAGLGYAIGASGWWWVGSAGIGSLILAFSVGPRIRKLAANQGFLTVGDFLEYRFGAEVRLIVAVLLWFGTLAILAGQLIAFAWILNVVSGTPKAVGCLLGGAVVVTYFSAGGLKGVVWVNLLQLLVKGTGFLVGLPVAIACAGGWQHVEALLQANGKPPEYFSISGIGVEGILGYLVLLAPAFIVSPGLLQKIYGARDESAVKWGTAANGIVLLIFAGIPVAFGMIAAALFPGLAHQEMALPQLMTELLPFWLGAILLASVFSAEISSADAILFMLSTSLSKDLYQRFLRPDLDDASMLRISRAIAIIAGGFGALLAMLFESVISALSVFYGLLSVALFAPLTVGLYRKSPGVGAALAAILVSATFSLALEWLGRGEGFGFMPGVALGILLSFAILLIASQLSRRRIRIQGTDASQ